MTEIAELIAMALVDLDYGVAYPVSGLPTAQRNTVNLVIAPHEFFSLQVGEAESELMRAAEASVSIGVEQPGTSWFEVGTHYASVGRAVLDISPFATAELRRRGLDATHLQLGYHTSLDHWGGDQARRRSKDLLFLGSMTERRSRFFGDAVSLLWDCEADIRLFEYSQPMTEPRANFVSGADKRQLLADSRVLLNVHRNAVPYLEWVRVLEAVSNGCLVLTEESADYGPLVVGEHLLATTYDTLAAYAASVLIDEPLRREISTAAYDFVRTKLELTALLEPICEALFEQGVPRPRPPLRTRSYRKTSSEQPLWDGGILEDIRVQERQIRMRIKELLDSETELVQKLEAIEAKLRFGDECHQEVTTTPAWAGFEPAVTVLITSYNYCAFIEQTISSAMASEGVAAELIIVDDHSQDSSVELVRSIMREHAEFPVMLIANSANAGVGAARNAGFKAARAERVFILDADNYVFPSALGKLAAALDREPEAAFSYGIIGRLDGSGVMSHLPWDPRRLLESNYIDAMAMVRRSVWEQVGGFDAFTSLRGWEDYELWLRIAAHGWDAAFVPQPLAAYRVHGVSRQQTVDLDTESLKRALRKRYTFLPWDDI